MLVVFSLGLAAGVLIVVVRSALRARGRCQARDSNGLQCDLREHASGWHRHRLGFRKRLVWLDDDALEEAARQRSTLPE
jgi:hypothetical protein